MIKEFRVIEIGTYWKEWEVEAMNHDDAEQRVRNGEGVLAREGEDVDQFETENLSLAKAKIKS